MFVVFKVEHISLVHKMFQIDTRSASTPPYDRPTFCFVCGKILSPGKGKKPVSRLIRRHQVLRPLPLSAVDEPDLNNFRPYLVKDPRDGKGDQNVEQPRPKGSPKPKSLCLLCLVGDGINAAESRCTADYL